MLSILLVRKISVINASSHFWRIVINYAFSKWVVLLRHSDACMFTDAFTMTLTISKSFRAVLLGTVSLRGWIYVRIVCPFHSLPNATQVSVRIEC